MESNNDWAYELAGELLSPIKEVYGIKPSPKEQPNEKKSEEASVSIDYDSSDYEVRDILKENIWKFSAAKSYDDCMRLNCLFFRPDGSIRSWNEFKREAIRILGFPLNQSVDSEYNTAIGYSMMRRKWREIQRDKHIFPYVQFKVTMDSHTSEICTPLSDIIVEVDDPFLQHYFPPNHFNCRTGVIKLRNATPTQIEEDKLRGISPLFKNTTEDYFKIDKENAFRIPISDENLSILKDFYK
ncbi:phage minor head protein [Riemerella columbipharyngis]|uniref:Phage Mu protein F like protein n=1 Tax=Riemerella columbipharyngis TaxID=1071918 RepID=A0A1G7FYE8_9FLAO|nr:phage minor head protein [Riemerella columbipharyngis]SDE80958.1 Phage Mu protein F like protein [Riemerella columbipharyngis]